jgi:nicotinamidase-related amidase
MLPAVLMHHQNTLELTRSALVVIDMQEAFRTKIADFAETAGRIGLMDDLLASGFQVHLLTDCITSRKQNDRKIAFRKMQASGAIPCSVELALFELMRDARHEQFRAIQGLIK